MKSYFAYNTKGDKNHIYSYRKFSVDIIRFVFSFKTFITLFL